MSKDKKELSQEQMEKIAGGKGANPSTTSSSYTSGPKFKHHPHPPVVHHLTNSSTTTG